MKYSVRVKVGWLWQTRTFNHVAPMISSNGVLCLHGRNESGPLVFAYAHGEWKHLEVMA